MLMKYVVQLLQASMGVEKMCILGDQELITSFVFK
jgi:hypothetical protein